MRPNTRRLWTPEETRQLLRLLATGESDAVIGSLLGRPLFSVVRKRQALLLIRTKRIDNKRMVDGPDFLAVRENIERSLT